MERLHKVSAGFVFAFLCLHFANHLVGLEGLSAHQQFMDAARLVYRHPVVELCVLLAFVVQIITGVPLVRTIWSERKDFVHQLQAASGVAMVVFILAHVAWIAVARLALNLDTNIYFVASCFSNKPLGYVVYGFYGVGIMALFVHMGCIIFDIFKKTSRPLGYVCLTTTVGVGVYVTYLLLMMYSGHFYPIDVTVAG